MELDASIKTVECAVADFSAVARGKIVSRQDFLAAQGCRLPSTVLGVTLTGGEPEAVFGPWVPTDYRDLQLTPDMDSAVLAIGRDDRLSVICEPTGSLPASASPQGCLDAQAFSPRAALRRVLQRLHAAGLQAKVAPELEFFLLDHHPGHAPPLQAAAAPGDALAREHAVELYSLERTTHFSAYFDALFAACERQRIPVTGYAHEAACSQYEVNFAPGEPLAMADAVWRFKRLARETAVRQGFLASFIAKPFLDQPGTGMHWHASLQYRDSGHNVFSDPLGNRAPALQHFIAGLQHEASAMLALLAPYEHSFERMSRSDASPTTASWGEDDRSVAFRLPAANPANCRVENRLPGGDASPYLVLASMLGLGLYGMQQRWLPLAVAPALPTSLGAASQALSRSDVLKEVLGEPLVQLYCALKQHESAERNACLQPRQDWDFIHLTEQA